MPRNPCPMNTYAWGSIGPIFYFSFEFVAKKMNCAILDVRPNTIAYTGLLMYAEELSVATPAPKME